MTQRIFVNVVGFSDVERHALNTVFRLSEERETAYAPWTSAAPGLASMLLVDGADREARLEVNWPGNAPLKLIWIGPDAPAHAWSSFERPIAWPEVVRSMDELFAPPVEVDFDLDAESDLDLDLDADPSTFSPDTQPPAAPDKRALIACASGEESLYMRARLALAGLTFADEAQTAVGVLDLIDKNRYDVVLLDFGLPGMDGWMLLKGLHQALKPVGRIVIFKRQPRLAERLRAKLGGAALFAKPPHPGKLASLLQKV